MRKNLLLAIAFALGIWAYLLMYAAASARQNAGNSSGTSDEGITAYFSPSGGCTAAIVNEINKASQSIDIEAYAFSSAPIADAVTSAFDRGVRVRLIVDKGQRSDHASAVNAFVAHHMTVYVDSQHGLAHNKVMVIDGKTLITGSFNFTKSSEERNAENLLVIHDHPKLVGSYEADFEHHLGQSLPIDAPAN